MKAASLSASRRRSQKGTESSGIPRFAAFVAAGQPGKAIVSDAAWGLGQCVATLGVLSVTAKLTWVFLAWGIGGLIATGIAIGQVGVLPRILSAADWLREYGDLSRPYLVEGVVLTVCGYTKNDLAERVSVETMAVGEANGSVTMYLAKGIGHHSTDTAHRIQPGRVVELQFLTRRVSRSHLWQLPPCVPYQ
ncbi:hypothetical protein NE236_26470 [Actinoallomurus purpureus]|uniref:hypothetical protein n=1 Tax=Actinoallomurus purpureus TaxID=478114 RepID=UPI002093B377|nr:hypothetical protein [Actinoallomurus purpureus]MCO6008524.1 hypothetical protein [Actinoallomurus purpureus]